GATIRDSLPTAEWFRLRPCREKVVCPGGKRATGGRLVSRSGIVAARESREAWPLRALQLNAPRPPLGDGFRRDRPRQRSLSAPRLTLLLCVESHRAPESVLPRRPWSPMKIRWGG